MVKPHRFLALLVGLLVAMAACGDGESTSVTTSTTTAPSSTTQVDASTTTVTTTSRATTTQTDPGGTVNVFFSSGDGSDCEQVAGFPRQIDPSADPIAEAFDQLVGGPTADEEAAGASSFFSGVTQDAIRSIDLVDGLLTVDFKDYRAELANASSSCGSGALLASLNATAFQFTAVESVRYLVLDSCNVFYGFLQRECLDQTRNGPVAVDLDSNAQASGSGCTPGTGELPDGEWFGYVDNPTGDTVEFDLACWFTGGAAADAAFEDGEESPPPNDYHIRNSSDELRTVPVGETVDVIQLATPGGPDTMAVTYVDWSTGWSGRFYQPGVWLTVVNGSVSAILEQYQP